MGIYCDTAHNQQSVMQMSHCSPLKEKKEKLLVVLTLSKQRQSKLSYQTSP